MKKVISLLVAAILTVFSFLTLFLSSSIIFDLFDIRAKEGHYVLFIVWANFVCSFIYLISVYGLLTRAKWTYKTLGLAAIILIVAFLGLLTYIRSGGLHETKTVFAMMFRITVTLGFAFFAYFSINKKSSGDQIRL